MLWVLIRIGEVILMSTHNIGFYEKNKQNYHQISSNRHLISSAAVDIFMIHGE